MILQGVKWREHAKERLFLIEKWGFRKNRLYNQKQVLESHDSPCPYRSLLRAFRKTLWPASSVSRETQIFLACTSVPWPKSLLRGSLVLVVPWNFPIVYAIRCIRLPTKTFGLTARSQLIALVYNRLLDEEWREARGASIVTAGAILKLTDSWWLSSREESTQYFVVKSSSKVSRSITIGEAGKLHSIHETKMQRFTGRATLAKRKDEESWGISPQEERSKRRTYIMLALYTFRAKW